MLIKEYRIAMPLTVEEYKTAQLYMVARFCRERTTKGEGIEIVKNEPYEDANGKGQYTHKIIHVGSSIPSWAKSMLPGSMLQVEEKAWNAYPYVKTVYSCPFFGERFSITSETRYFDNDLSIPNALNLPETILPERQVDYIDIVSEDVDPKYYKKEEDLRLFQSKKTARGPYEKGWEKTAKPLMCIYKVTSVEFKVWGLQTRVEQWLQKAMVRDVILLGHKQAFCWIDEWFGMTIEELRKYEDETKALLDKILGGHTPSAEQPKEQENKTDDKKEEGKKEEKNEETK